MARTVTDAAILLGVLEGAAPDPNDPATKTCTPPPGRDYTPFLQARRAEGRAHRHPARVLLRRDDAARARARRAAACNAAQAAVMAEAIAVLKARGRRHRRSRRHPERRSTPTRRRTSSRWGDLLRARTTARASDANCSVVFKYGMKRDFNAWLATLGAAAPVKTLTELRLWNLAHARARRDQVRPVAISTSRTRWTCGATARATRPIARRTSRSSAHERHRRGDEGQQARRAAVPRRRAARRSPRSPATRP